MDGAALQRWGSDWLLISNVTKIFPIDVNKIIIGNSDRSQIPFQRTDNNLQISIDPAVRR
jgi:hypothetical protein